MNRGIQKLSSILALLVASPAFAINEECKIVVNTDDSCDKGVELVRFQMNASSNNQGLNMCNQLSLVRNGAELSAMLARIKNATGGLDADFNKGISGAFWEAGDKYTFNEEGELIAVKNQDRYDLLPGKHAVRCFRKTNGAGDNTWRQAHPSDPGERGAMTLCNLIPSASFCNYSVFPKLKGAAGTSIADVCPAKTKFSVTTGHCECASAECCTAGLIFSEEETKCIAGTPTADCDPAKDTCDQQKFAAMATGIDDLFKNRVGFDSDANDNAVNQPELKAMAGSHSLADQGLLAATAPPQQAAVTESLLDRLNPAKLFGNLVSNSGKANGGGTSSGKGTGGELTGTGSGAANTTASTASQEAYAGGRGGAMNGSGAGANGSGGMGGGRNGAFGSDIGGGSAVVAANGQTPNQEFGTRAPASADGARAMNGTDPDDYFTRTGLTDNLFKLVERRYREKQTGWVLAPSAKK